VPAGTAILATLGAFLLLSVAIGVFARRRAEQEAEFLLGGRRLGPIVAGISASATSSSAWTLLGVSGFAYANGLAAVWLFPACVGGFCINWFLLAPRLRRYAAERGAVTMTDLLTSRLAPRAARALRVLIAWLTFVALLAYVSSQFQGAGKLFGTILRLDPAIAILAGSAVVLAYSALGGFVAISRNDTLQGLVMAATAVVLPAGALLQVLQRPDAGAALGGDWFRGATGAAAVGFVLGLLGIGLGYPGQPHVIGFLMAVRDEAALRGARRCALLWAVLVYAGMITLGICARLLMPGRAGDPEQILLLAAGELFPPIVVGLMVAGILSAILSTVDSQLLVATAALTHDVAPRAGAGVGRHRAVMAGIAAVAAALALIGDPRIFTRVLSAWSAMGAGFGPLLLWLLWIGAPGMRARLAAVLVGFGGSALAYAFEPTRNTWVERVLPFVAAAAVLVVTRRRSRAPAPAPRPSDAAPASCGTPRAGSGS
jgi:sodium/proline symporter